MVVRTRFFALPPAGGGDTVTASECPVRAIGVTSMSVEENVNLMRRWFEEVWNQGKIQTVRDLLAPDAIGIGQLEDGSNVKGPASFVPFVERIRGGFPDIKVVIEDAFGSGDRVVVRWSANMTHRGDQLGMAATGKAVRLRGITIARIVGNQIV